MENEMLYVHIGTHKTGTTTIQRTLLKNREYFEHTWHTSYINIKSRYLLELDKITEVDPDRVSALQAVVDSHLEDHPGMENYVVSSESFCGDALGMYKNSGVAIENVHRIFGKYDPVVVVYYRSQEQYVQSIYNQKAKLSRSWTWDTLFDRIRDDLLHLNWLAHAEKLTETFPKGRVKVKLYDEQVLPNADSLVLGFLKILGVDVGDNSELRMIHRNVGYPESLLSLMGEVNKFLGEDEIIKFRHHIERQPVRSSFEAYHFMNFEDRIQMFERFGSENMKLCEMSEDAVSNFTRPRAESSSGVDAVGFLFSILIKEFLALQEKGGGGKHRLRDLLAERGARLLKRIRHG
jgi:hypothetical protein